jgi:glycosyltransferase involved in cell wall biosynthesis
MQAQGAEPAILFVLDAGDLAERLDDSGIPHSALGLQRGRTVATSPRRLARMARASAPDVAILTSSGYLAASLRAGGFRAPVIAIEHGSLLQLDRLPPFARWKYKADRISGARVCDAVVPVSEYIKERLDLMHLRRRIVCISNGVDLERFSPAAADASVRKPTDGIQIGCAARLVEGKGIEDAITALTHPSLEGARLRVAGEGPLLQSLTSLAVSLSVEKRVELLGPVLDMPGFWQSVDVAVVPSNGLIESFGMVAIEAMACGKPVVVTDSGALPDIVSDGETGRVVEAGDVGGLAKALSEYARDPAIRAQHGMNGRRRCEERFGIDRTAARYLELCADLAGESRGNP